MRTTNFAKQADTEDWKPAAYLVDPSCLPTEPPAPLPPIPKQIDTRQEVVITGIRISFSDMLNVLFTAGLAAIPAMILLSVVFGMVSLGLYMLLGHFLFKP